MNKIDPKQYTKQTILHGSGKRITLVLKRYWQLKNKNSAPDIVDIAKKIFNG
jgi:hypothetical protein